MFIPTVSKIFDSTVIALSFYVFAKFLWMAYYEYKGKQVGLKNMGDFYISYGKEETVKFIKQNRKEKDKK